MILNERNCREELVVEAGRRMLAAIRTAPKARGVDIVEAVLITGDDLKELSAAMLDLYNETQKPVFQRDAANILQGDAVVVVGTHTQEMGLNCGHCGFPTCGEKPATVPCVFNSVDVGIALGSACSIAADMRVDTRVMYSAGMGALRMDALPGCRLLFAIALSATSKNPFFDRK